MTPKTAYKAIEEGIKKGQYKVPDPPKCPDIVEGSRKNAIDIMKDYIALSIKQANRGKTDNKFPLLGTSGMAGIGKTTMLLYGLQELIGTGGKGVYLSFNGNGTANSNVFADSKASSADRLSLHCFGDVLMAVLRVQDDLYRVLKFQQSLTLFRTAMDMTEEQPLVLFIDEVGHLKEPDGLLKELMSEADSRDGKLVFVFAHISQQYLNMCATGSGRTVIPLPLEALPIDAWKQDADLKVSAQGHAGIHQLLLQCCGHPRSLFDGVEEARKKNPTLLTNPTEAVLSVARQNIIDACKFNSFAHPYLQTVIPKWFSILGKTPQFHDQLRRDGLLLEVKETEATVFFPPLVLHHYATTYAEENSLCFHLQQAYAHDAMLGKFAEKNMEGLLYHYEAVLRKAVEGQTFTLNQFYRSKHCGEKFRDLCVKAPVPPATGLVKQVQNLQNQELVLDNLNSGFIVVSDLQNEAGIEYLAPFRTAEDNKLIVACAQCKFVEKSPDSSWREIQTKMSTATDWLKKQKIQHFPVIYATADQRYMQRRSYEDGIYFIEDDIFEFTKKLGVLRLHTQKLGEKMQQKHPYLQRASSNADMWYFPLFHCFTNQNRRRTDQMQAGKERTLLRRQGTSMDGYTKSKFWQFDFKGWTKLVWSLFNIIYMTYMIMICMWYIWCRYWRPRASRCTNEGGSQAFIQSIRSPSWYNDASRPKEEPNEKGKKNIRWR